jgi:hypothetical protein
MIERCIREERARLDLKWCLDQYFGWNVSSASLEQFVTANISGLVNLAYIIDIKLLNIMVIPADMLGNSTVVRFDDIYAAEEGPFYEKFLLNHRFFHSQRVLDYVANQKSQQELMQVNHKCLYDMIRVESAYEYSEIEWPEGDETWLCHDELPQRIQFVQP